MLVLGVGFFGFWGEVKGERKLDFESGVCRLQFLLRVGSSSENMHSGLEGDWKFDELLSVIFLGFSLEINFFRFIELINS